MKKAVEELKAQESRRVKIIHHDDGDGLAAAAIAKASLERQGYDTSLVCIEKLYPEVVEKVHSQRGNIIFYVDIAAAHAKLISKYNQRRNFTIVLDHHDAEPSEDETVYNLDPELYGISGETDVSGATVTYLFFKTLNVENVDLSRLAVVGSAEIPGMIRGLNAIALEDALKSGYVKIRLTRTGKDYIILKPGRPESFRNLSSKLTVLGSVGYYRGGPKKAVQACIDGFDEEIEDLAEKFEDERKAANKKLLGQLYREGLKQLKSIQWFHSRDIFKGMGAKVIGTFCSFMRFQKIVNPMKYIVGFMNMSREIPDFGILTKSYVKVSARTTAKLEEQIKAGGKLPLSKLLPATALKFNGFGDGHAFAASGVIQEGKEEAFAEEMDRLASVGG
jgi:single-stranded DNA-specific DHH superfamily exonuclease